MSLFFDFIQVALGLRKTITVGIDDTDWQRLFLACQKQSLAGIGFSAMERLHEQGIICPADIRMKWMSYAMQIERQNALTGTVCGEITSRFEEDGFDTCILKGLANTIYYPETLRARRQPGDIDIWLRAKVGATINYLERRNEILSLCHLHAEIKPESGVPIEVHFRPSFLNAPWRNRRFQKLFATAECITETSGTVRIEKLRTELDLIYQMNHIYRHLLDEGVGLRQVIDYYFILKAFSCLENVEGREWVMRHIRACGMLRFARALMWVLQKVLAMPDSMLLCTPSQKDGKFLLSEIMQAGNFGKFDSRMSALTGKKGHLSFQLQRASRRFRRNLRFISSYPEEVICEPFARIAHFTWKRLRLWRF